MLKKVSLVSMIVIAVLTLVVGTRIGLTEIAAMRTASQMRALMLSYPGVRVSCTNGSVVLTGEVSTISEFSDVKMISNAAELNADRPAVVNLVRLSESGRESVIQQINREVTSPHLLVRFVHDKLIMEGTAESEYEADRAVELASAVLEHRLPVRKPSQDVTETIGSGVVAKGPGQAGFAIVDLMRIRPPSKK